MGNAIDIERVIREMAAHILSLDLPKPLLVGIHTGGVWVASHLQRELDISSRPGMLDISFYRDDFTRVGLHPEVRSSELPDPVEDRNVILVDDVLYSGRTVRAAMNEIFSYGRPARVVLAVLIERPGRELPIQPDIVGSRLVLDDNEQAKLTHTDGILKLNIIRPGNTHEGT
ncbi:MAG: bifunctional pyr operon transcriptional regulator/uracil phosphoribosyltransferase PyrR [Gammaproteobacteria bacterium]|nr:bifunctional pyr operon transcriptional regulator/uracil phosphoribosyltransferase PyrR [Gammaproteobacteria bacterium]